MDVKSVNKPAVQPAPSPKRPVEAHPAPVRDNRPKENEAHKSASSQQSKPVVNTQGHLTGRHLNVTA